MLAKLLLKKKQIETTTLPASKYLIAKTGSSVLNVPSRQAIIKKIKRTFSVTESVWNDHYSYAIERFAEIAQELPASEIHHHSKEGGLVDHTLEAVFAGVRVTQGYILPPNSEAEKISAASDRWRFGVFISILAHDLGKVVTDLEVVYRTSEQQPFCKWHPWYGNIPPGAEYTFRYRERLKISRIDKSLHEKATMSLLPNLLTKKATFWLFDDYELIGQIFNTITHSTFGGGVVSEIVRKADSSSVSKNLGADTGVGSNYSKNIPLHEKIITSLRYLIQDGELKRNRPGAALWVYKDETWVVSKPAIEAAQSKLLNEGHKGIPKNVVRLFETLREHGLLIPTAEGNSVWTATINDYSNNWEQNLTFLRFKNEIIWPNSEPEQFKGSITPVDKNGKPINEELEVDKRPEEKAVDIESLPANRYITKESENSESIEDKKEKVTITPKSKPSTLKPKVVAEIKKETVSQKKINQIPDNDFFAWMLKEVGSRKLRVNEQRALIHVIDNYIALVTPKIFISFLTHNPIKASIYKSRAGEMATHKYLQKEIEALNINKKSMKGENIHTLFVEGPHKQTTLKVYLLDRTMFPSMDNFSPNKALRIAD